MTKEVDDLTVGGPAGVPVGVVGVDLGGTKTAAALVLPDARVLCEVTAATPARDGAAAVVATVVALVDRVRADAATHGLPAPRLLGVGSAGVIDSDAGTVVSATDALPGWAGTPLARRLGTATGLEVHVLNDVHAHALGEARSGAGAGRDPVLLVAAGTGVGGALVVGGEVLGGAHGAAGHLGHVASPGAGEITCTCGAVGHLEAIASGPAVVATHRRLGGTSSDARDVVVAALAGDPLATRAVDLAADALGRALGGWVNTFDPEVVVLTGGLASAGGHWWSRVVQAAGRELVPAVRDVPVVPAALGARAALVGAALFARERAGRSVLTPAGGPR